MKQRLSPPMPMARLNAFQDKPAATLEEIPTSTNPAVPTAPVSNVIRKIPLNLIDDSPFQPRLTYNSIELDELGCSFTAAGQQKPIQVRIVTAGRFELIGGHRRVRAARNIGWEEIDAQIIICDDRGAKKSALLENEGGIDLTEYEHGKAYKNAIDAEFVRTQNDLAMLFGCSQGKISKCIAMMDLPAPYLELLEVTPSLFGAACAKVISDLHKKYPQESDLIMEGVRRIAEGAPQGSLNNWVEQKLTKQAPIQRSKDAVVTDKEGRALFAIKSTPQGLIVKNEAGEQYDEDKVRGWLRAALQQQVEMEEKNEEINPPE